MEPAPQDALFAEAVREHLGIFLKTAYGFAAPADRDDLLQEMYLAVWQALPTYDERLCKLSTFLYRVANNRALNWNRSRRRYRQKIDVLQKCPRLVVDSADSQTQTERLEWLYALVRQLPSLDRTILLLHFDRLSHQEIGEVTGLTESNVGVRMHRIKQWIAKQKGPEHGT